MKRVWQALLISLVLSLAGLFVALRGNLDLGAAASVVRVNPLGFGLVVLALLGWWLCAGWRIQLLAKDMGGRVTLSRATRAYILGLFSASVTPAATGSSLAIGWYLSRYLSPHQAAGIAAYTVALDLVFYAWSLPVSFLVLEAGGVNLGIPRLGLYVVVVAVLMLGLGWALAYRASALAALVWRLFGLGFLRRFRRRAYGFVSRTGQNMAQFTRMPLPTQLALHVSTAALYLVHFAVLNAVAVALGLQMNHLNVLALQTLIVALSFLVPTPGGSGYFEVALGLALVGQVPTSAKALLILLWRLFSYWLYFLIGPAIGGMALLRSSGNKAGVPEAPKGR